MISEVDAQLGRIWQAVKAAGAWDDTIVILTSDHAEMMGDHFMLGKGGFFDGSYHIPLIIRDPRQQQGRRHHASTASPKPSTSCRRLLDLLGRRRAAASRRPLAGAVPRRRNARRPGATRRIGSSISARSPKGTAERHFGIGSRQCNLAVIRTDKFKYVHFGGGLPPLLFDLDDDPGELTQSRRRSCLPAGAAGLCRAAACLAGRASRPVAGACPTDGRRRRRHVAVLPRHQ